MNDLPKLTEKENKCLMLWLTNGRKQSEAYKGAYDCSNMSDNAIYVESSRFFKNPKITQWIDYYLKNTQQTLQEQLDYNAKKHFEELNEMKMLAMECRDKYQNPNVNVALKAVELKGKLAGLYQESREENENGTVNVMGTIKIDGQNIDFNVGEKVPDKLFEGVEDEGYSTAEDT